jgi:hypothetical protein
VVGRCRLQVRPVALHQVPQAALQIEELIIGLV